MESKILVCITAQSNSTRLIDKGNETAKEHGGELIVLYVEKGDNVFATEESPRILQELYSYAARLGGVVTGLCGDDVFLIIKKFIADNQITHVVFGESNEGTGKNPIADFTDALINVEVVVLPRV